jgi:peptide/nickel transport system substrate-binding protein
MRLIGQGDRCGEGLLLLNPKYPPWSNVHVRRAVAYAINRNHVLLAQGAPQTTTLDTMITPDQFKQLGTPAQVKAVLKDVPRYPYNLAKAKQELALSPWPHGFSGSADTFNAYGLPDIMQAISADLKKIGINMKFSSIGINAFLSKFYGPKPTHEAMYFDSLGCYYPDVGQFPNLFLGKDAVKGSYPWSLFRYLNPEAARLTAAANATTNKAKRLAFYGQILRIQASDVAYLPLTTEAYFGVINKKYTFPGFGWFGGDYWPWALGIKKA